MVDTDASFKEWDNILHLDSKEIVKKERQMVMLGLFNVTAGVFNNN